MQAEMIAVEVLSHSVSDDVQNASSMQPQIDTGMDAKAVPTTTGSDAPNVINLVQAQVLNGSQVYSLQINGQTIPFTTIQLPLGQADELAQQATCLQIASSDDLTGQQVMATTSTDMSSLNLSTSVLQLPCTPVKDDMSNQEGQLYFFFYTFMTLIHLYTLVYTFIHLG